MCGAWTASPHRQLSLCGADSFSSDSQMERPPSRAALFLFWSKPQTRRTEKSQASVVIVVIVVNSNRNHAKRSRNIVGWSCREEQLIHCAVPAVNKSVTEANPPQLVDYDSFPMFLHRVHELSGGGVKGIDRSTVDIVRDQQRIAQPSKSTGRHSNSPGLIQRQPVDQWLRHSLCRCAVFVEHLDKATASSVCVGKCHVDQSIDILDTEGHKSCRQRGIGKRRCRQYYRCEGSVVNIHLPIGHVGSEQVIPGLVVADGQPGVHRWVRILIGSRIHDQSRLVGIQTRRPPADGSV